jgi:hypothetical protein
MEKAVSRYTLLMAVANFPAGDIVHDCGGGGSAEGACLQNTPFPMAITVSRHT